jgi:transcriptional regulator with XRE-family HTH domain
MTLTALSKVAHISIAHISDIERGQTTAGPDIVECLAKGLGIPTSEFIQQIYHYLREINE